ncbi:MAG: hypothetical protein EKK56_07800 [Flavobacteriaceae bacterium]|nr:MAG: hypothetical protein EKK56_07800 [Flavobacteriaceae bacterium]
MEDRVFGFTIFTSKKVYNIDNDSKQYHLTFSEIINAFKVYYDKEKNLNKETVKLFIAGVFKSINTNRRTTENLISRSMITIDIDNYQNPLDNLEEEISKVLEGYNYIYYSTSKHTYDKPRIRLIIPLLKDIERSIYKETICKTITNIFSKDFLDSLDKNASFGSNQLMYLYYDNGQNDNIFKYVLDKSFLNIETENNLKVIQNDEIKLIKEEITSEEFEKQVYNLPLNINDEKIRNILDLYIAEETDYHSWFEVCQGLHHQYQGNKEGYKLFLEWSLKDNRYSKEEIEQKTKDKYFSLSNKEIRPITFATIIKRLNNKKQVPSIIEKKNYLQINPEAFLHLKKNNTPKATYENFCKMLDVYKIKIALDIITKNKVSSLKTEGNIETIYTRLKSLSILNNMNKDMTIEYTNCLAFENITNSFKLILDNVVWDGQDRLEDFYNTLEVKKEYEKIRNTYLLKWLKQLLYLALWDFKDKNKKIGRYVLILQGLQEIGKSTWINHLLPDNLRTEYILIGSRLNTDDNMSVYTNIKYLIVEFAELNQTFAKSDINSFKAFFGRTHDVINHKYDPVPRIYPRTTSYIATVNDYSFLKDETGNTRFLILPIIKANAFHNIDMLQLYKQILDTKDWINFELDEEQKIIQKELNNNFDSIDPLEELFFNEFSKETNSEEHKYYQITQILEILGYSRREIDKRKANNLASILRKYGYQYISNSKYGWKLKRNIKELEDEFKI